MEEDLDAVNSFEKTPKNMEKKEIFTTQIQKQLRAAYARETKMILEFNNHKSASIKSFAVKKSNQIKVTTRFFVEKCSCLLNFHL